MKVLLAIFIIFVGVFLYMLLGKYVSLFFSFLADKYKIRFGFSTEMFESIAEEGGLITAFWGTGFILFVLELALIAIVLPFKISSYIIFKNTKFSISNLLSLKFE